jgi:hypothetical protein
VKTDSSARGYTVFTRPRRPAVLRACRTEHQAVRRSQDYENDYHNPPSLNLRLKASDTLQFRLAIASALSRPDFTQLQGYTTLSETADTSTNPVTGVTTVNSVSLTGSGDGNPMLRPTTSRQIDLTAEWYFAPSGSFTAAVFNKRLKDIVVKQTYIKQLADTSGKLHDFTVTGPINAPRATHAASSWPSSSTSTNCRAPCQAWACKPTSPSWTASANCTRRCTRSTAPAATTRPMNLNMNGCDTNGTTFGNLPLETCRASRTTGTAVR